MNGENKIRMHYNIPATLLYKINDLDLSYDYNIEDLQQFVYKIIEDVDENNVLRNPNTLKNVKIILENIMTNETNNQVIKKLQELSRDIDRYTGVYSGDEIVHSVVSNLNQEYVEFEEV